MTTVLHRDFPAAITVRADGTDGRTIFGRAVPYGETIEVVDSFGRYRERFERGAFARSIAERLHKVKLMVQHDRSRLPIGRAVDLEERDDGLHGAFAVAATRDGDDALELVRSGTVDAFSIGFAPIRERDDDGVVVRTEAALREVSLVGFPAYAGAAIAGIRSDTPTLPRAAADRRLRLALLRY